MERPALDGAVDELAVVVVPLEEDGADRSYRLTLLTVLGRRILRVDDERGAGGERRPVDRYSERAIGNHADAAKSLPDWDLRSRLPALRTTLHRAHLAGGQVVDGGRYACLFELALEACRILDRNDLDRDRSVPVLGDRVSAAAPPPPRAWGARQRGRSQTPRRGRSPPSSDASKPVGVAGPSRRLPVGNGWPVPRRRRLA
jgi:hypothetical protein